MVQNSLKMTQNLHWKWLKKYNEKMTQITYFFIKTWILKTKFFLCFRDQGLWCFHRNILREVIFNCKHGTFYLLLVDSWHCWFDFETNCFHYIFEVNTQENPNLIVSFVLSGTKTNILILCWFSVYRNRFDIICVWLSNAIWFRFGLWLIE